MKLTVRGHWDGTYDGSPEEKFEYSCEVPFSDLIAKESKMKKVIVMVGLPGSGKTTYVHRELLRQLPNAYIFSADQYMVDGVGNYEFNPNKLGNCLNDFTHAMMAQHEDAAAGVIDSVLIVDNTNLTNVERAPYISLALAFGYEVDVITVQAQGLSMADLAKRNVHGVSEETLQRMVDKYEAELWAPWKYNPLIKTKTVNGTPRGHTTNDGWGNK